MRLAPLALSIIMLGIPGNLEAARTARKPVRVSSTVHPVRRGETAAKVARTYGLSLAQLEDLNPKVNLAKLSVGTPLRVKGRPEPRVAPAEAPAEPVQTVNLAPVAPIPAIPVNGPAVLVHLERLIPNSLEAAPAKKAVRGAAPFTSQDLAPVLPSNTGLEYETQVSASLGFEPADPNDLDLLWPVATRSISSAWGPRIRSKVVQVKSGKKNRRVRVKYQGSHKGIDLTAPTGTDVYAAQDGVVTVAKRDSGYGNYLVLDHGNGVQTLYAHNNKLFARVGELVQRGQKIAEVGRTGHATGPHLHFELKLDGVAQNPLPVLNDVEEIPTELMAFNSTVSGQSR
jgi:murein DD-endopeptidase MepM/ murein hydrolase activator NlpD